jgi:hypothetical protein
MKSNCGPSMTDGRPREISVAPLVAIGQRVIAGESILADLKGSEGARLGEVR